MIAELPTFNPTPDTTERTYFTAPTALKAYEDGRIGGYLVVWGNPSQRDLHGEYFTRDTDLKLDWYSTRPVLWHHGLDKEIKATEIGVITTLKQDDYGLYAEAILDINHDDPAKRLYARRAYKLVQEGKLGWSSGSAPNLVDVTPDGQIKQWAIVEGTLTPAPAEPRRTNVQAIKSLLSALPEDEEAPIEPPAKEAKRIPSGKSALFIRSLPSKKGQFKMGINPTMIEALREKGFNADQILDVLGVVGVGDDIAEVEDVAAMAEDVTDSIPQVTPDDMTKTVEEAVAKAFAKHAKTAPAPDIAPMHRETPAQVPPAQTGLQVIQTYTKYSRMDARDMAYLDTLRKARAIKDGGQATPLGKAFYSELLEKTQKSIKSNDIILEHEDAVRILAIKDNELDNTGNATAAGNWVPELWYSDLWERARVENKVLSQFQSIEMPSPVFNLPIESTDPTVYHVPETTNAAQLNLDNESTTAIPSSVVQAGKVQLNAKKLELRVGFSAEMDEDSIIPFIPQLRNQAMLAMMGAMDNVILNGDTTTGTSNINLQGTNVQASDHYRWSAFDGLRHLPLVGNPALGVDASGATPTLQMIRQAYQQMYSLTPFNDNVYSIDPANLVIFTDVPTYGKMLNINELLVYMTNGQGSTVNNGQVPTIDGITVIPTAQLALSATNGFVSGTAASNTRGQVLIAAKRGWYVGFRRRINSALDYLSYYDSYQLTLTVRLAFINRDNYSASMLYNVGIN